MPVWDWAVPSQLPAGFLASWPWLLCHFTFWKETSASVVDSNPGTAPWSYVALNKRLNLWGSPRSSLSLGAKCVLKGTQ